MNQDKLYKNAVYLLNGYEYVFYSTVDVAKQMNVELHKNRKWWDVFRLKGRGWSTTYISASKDESIIIPTEQIAAIRSVLTDVSDLLGDEIKEGTVTLKG